MSLFNVYPRFDVNITHASGVYVYDDKDNEYLDLYGGHGVISIGHTHPVYTRAISEQIAKVGFYSNSVQMPIQDTLDQKLSAMSGYPDYALFLCNSGAEANENALKLASFHTSKKKIVAFRSSFHGRTAAALNVTDNPAISSPINKDNFPVEWIEMNDITSLNNLLKKGDVAAVIIEGIQGVGGLDMPTDEFLKDLRASCTKYQSVLILDEIQSGFGRTGHFFAHQSAQIQADIISMAKGMGNGFPIGGVLISPDIEPKNGMLGTTFGGNHLACAASIAVLDVIDQEQLMENAKQINSYLRSELEGIASIGQIKGKGLMFGVDLGHPVQPIRKQLLAEYRIFTGGASNPNVLRILPPLNITIQQIEPFTQAIKTILT